MDLGTFLEKLEAGYDPGFHYHEPMQFIQAVADLDAPSVHLYIYEENTPIVVISDREDRRWGCYGQGNYMSLPRITLQLEKGNVRYPLKCQLISGSWSIYDLHSPLVSSINSEGPLDLHFRDCRLAGIRLTDFEARTSAIV